MPRRKWPTHYTVANGPSRKAKAELWYGIHRVIRYANLAQPITADSPELARVVDAAFTGLSQGRPFTLTGPDELTIPIANLGNLVMPRAGYYLRRCPHCSLWFLGKDGRRLICYKPACTKAASRARTATVRRIDAERQRASRRG